MDPKGRSGGSHVCVFIHMSVFIYLHVTISLCMHVSMYVYMCICIDIYIYVYIGVCGRCSQVLRLAALAIKQRLCTQR